MKKLTKLWLLLVVLITANISANAQEMRDSLVTRTITETVMHDTTHTIICTTTYPVSHDSIYTKVDTFKVPIIVPPTTNIVLRGMYGHPDQVNIGNAASENAFLTWVKREDVNMINMYARAYLYDESGRTKLAAFVKKAKEQYGILEFSVDVRLTDSRELPGWKAYFAKYKGTISMINALTEFEPWIKNSAGQYDYPGFFNLVRTMGNLCDQNNSSLDYYEGWVGNSYSNPQAAVDSMVKYCDRVFISNYVSVSDYNSSSTSLGAWDARMDKRCIAIAASCKKLGKRDYPIVEIVSLEPSFLLNIYACPASSTNKCNTFFGPLYYKAIVEYKKSTADVLYYTKLVGRTMFYSKYAKQAHP